MKTCSKCKTTKSLDLFAWKDRNSGIKSSECKECHKKVRRAYYERNRSKEIENAKISKSVRRPLILEKYKELKKTLKCNRCEQNHPATLQFHHVDKFEKENSISKMVRGGFSMSKIMKEIEKCEVLCANCHAIEHYDKFF